MTPANHRRRSLPVLAGGGVLAALTLALGVNGSLTTSPLMLLSADPPTAAAHSTVALHEVGGGARCVTTAHSASNTATCTGVNHYGGSDSQLRPGGTQTTTVTLTNTGTSTGDLSLTTGTCSTAANPARATNLCAAVRLTVDCPSGTAQTRTSHLAAWQASGPVAVATLTPGASISCQFSVTVPETVQPGQTISQPLLWTLTGQETI